jgi:recombination endonuclease VII
MNEELISETSRKKCSWCGLELPARRSRFCSDACLKESGTDSYLQKKYKITLQEYNQMLERQKGVCAICQKKPGKGKKSKRLAVDHSHKTGKVRGLLCLRCNHYVLGKSDENPITLRRAADYLEQFTN